MAFFSPSLHEVAGHARLGLAVYDTAQVGPLCVGCLLASLADASQLASRKVFVLREFIRQFGPEGPDGAAPLQQLLAQHAATLVPGLLDVLASAAALQDSGLANAVLQAALAMCACAPEYLPEQLTERALRLLLELPWPSAPAGDNATSQQQQQQQHPAAASTTIAASLALLQELVANFPAAARLTAGALQQSSALAGLMCGGLCCGLEAIMLPLLSIFSMLAAGGSSSSNIPHAAAGSSAMLDEGASSSLHGGVAACWLPPHVAGELLLRLLQLLPQLTAAAAAAGIKAAILQTLLDLVSTGNAVEHVTASAPLLQSQQQQAASQASQVGPASQQQQHHHQHHHHHAAVGSTVMAGLRHVLQDADAGVRLLGCQVLAAVAARAPGPVLQQLMAADACEHVFDVLRAALASCSTTARAQPALLAAQAAPARTAGEESAGEAIQVASLAALHSLAMQGALSTFVEHLHFGLDTLTDLLAAATAACHTSLQAGTLLLLCEVTGPDTPSSRLLPGTSLARLAAAAVEVLPAVSSDEAAAAEEAAVAAGPGAGRGGLQPPPEQQEACQLACRLLSHLCNTWCLPTEAQPGGSSAAAALQPHILMGAHRALTAMAVLPSHMLAGGFMAASALLLQAAVKRVALALAATEPPAEAPAQQQQQQQQQQDAAGPRRTGTAAATGGAGLGRVGGGSSSALSKQKQPSRGAGKQPAAPPKKRQALQRPGSSSAAAPGMSAGAGGAYASGGARHPVPTFVRPSQALQQAQQAADAAQELLSDALVLYEGCLHHMLPAAARALDELAGACSSSGTGAGGGGASWMNSQQRQQQQELAAAAAELFTAVTHSLLALYDAGATLPRLGAFLPALSQQLLGPRHSWASWSLDLIASLALPGPAAAPAWQVLLAAALQLQGAEFFSPHATPNVPALAASLAGRAGNDPPALLELLGAGGSASGGGAGSGGSSGRHGASRSSSATAAAAGTGDIRQFCGMTDLSRVALCVVAAVLRSGDGACWALPDVAASLDAAVAAAGRGMLAQPDLLMAVVRLYAQVEAALLADQQQTQTMMMAAPAAPTPAAILRALVKLGPSLPALPPSDAAAWICGHARAAAAPAQLLLQRWMAGLLAPRGAADSTAAAAGMQAAAPVLSDSGDLPVLLSLLEQQPSAVELVLQLAWRCLEQHDTQALTAWLSVLAALAMHSSSSSLRLASGRDNASATAVLCTLLHGSAAGQGADAVSLLQLVRRAALSCTPVTGGTDAAAAAGTLGHGGSTAHLCSLLLLACSAGLTAVGAAVASGAAAAAAADSAGGASIPPPGPGASLWVQAVQLSRLVCSRVVQMHGAAAGHSSLLLASAASAALTVLHAGVVTGADPSLLQQHAGSADVCRVMHLVWQAATAATDAGQATLQDPSNTAPPTDERSGLSQLIAGSLGWCGLLAPQRSAASPDSGEPWSGAGAEPDGQQQKQPALCGPGPDALCIMALQWEQRTLLVQQQQRASSSSAEATAGSAESLPTSDVSTLQLLLLAQARGPSPLSLVLLNAVSLRLRQAPRQPDELPWLELLTALQNMAAAAGRPAACSSQCRLAAVGCLGSLYTAAAAGGSDSGAALLVASSPWHAEVLAPSLQRLCDEAAALQAAAASAGVGGAGGSGGWLLDPDAQLRAQLWCADAELLHAYLSLQAAATSASPGPQDSLGSAAHARVRASWRRGRAQLASSLESQQLLAALCWAVPQAASVVSSPANSNAIGGGGGSGRNSRQAVAAAGCVALQLSDVALALLQALLDAGLLTAAGSQARVKEQLQAAAWALHEQLAAQHSQQPLRRSLCTQLMAAGGLQALAGEVEVLGSGVVLAGLLLQGAAAQHVLSDDAASGGDALTRLQQLLARVDEAAAAADGGIGAAAAG